MYSGLKQVKVTINDITNLENKILYLSTTIKMKQKKRKYGINNYFTDYCEEIHKIRLQYMARL